MKPVCVVVMILLLCASPFSQGQQSVATNTNVIVPPLVNFGGVLTDVNGKPLTGIVGVTFSLYQEQEGGSPLWMETQNVEPDETGHYSVMLGATSSTGLPANLFASGQAHWLGVEAQGQPEQPRVMLLSVPYALKAADAQTVGGLPPSAFVQAQPHSAASSLSPTAGKNVSPLANGPVTGAGTVDYIPVWDSTSDIISSVMFQSGSGSTAKIGIGTTTPSSTLDVNGGGLFTSNLAIAGDIRADINGLNKGSYTPAIRFGTGNTGEAVASDRAGTVNVNGIDLYTDFTPRLSVTNSGNVGIGTTAPAGAILNTVATSSLVAGFATVGWSAATGSGLAGTNAIIATAGNGDTTGGTGLVATGGTGDVNGNGGAGAVITGGAAGNTTSGTVFPGAGTGIVASGGAGLLFGSGGAGGIFTGGSVSNFGLGLSAGPGIIANGGGTYEGGGAGDGVEATGGSSGGIGVVSTGGTGGDMEPGLAGILTTGGIGVESTGGPGIVATGGGVPEGGGNGGDGIDAFAGTAPTGFVNGLAGSFAGDVSITGKITVTGTKHFKIDHPLDPANKYLYHASVESSEVLNLYSGNVTLDGDGEATVQLPDWFESLNRDFRYQLTAIGAAAPNLHIAQEVQNQSFRIAGGLPGMKVSWQVTGIRQDAWEKAHPMAVEVAKSPAERGYYINPELFGAPPEKSIDWARNPQLMKRMKALQAKQIEKMQAMRASGANAPQ